MKYQLLFFLGLVAQSIGAQSSLEYRIAFSPILQGQEVKLAVEEAPPVEAAVSITKLKFYISGVELWEEEQVVYQEPDSYHLIDISQAGLKGFNLLIPQALTFTHLKFKLGVDSLTNVSGAFGGDLDPTKGMYWTWQSGYINFKLEGQAVASPARNDQFQYHIGGYSAPYNSLQEVSLILNSAKGAKVLLDLDRFFEEIDVADNYRIMSPNATAVKTATLLSKLFSISE